MPIIYLGAELVIERIHTSRVISYRDIIKQIDELQKQYLGTSDEEAAYLLADKLGVEIDLDAELQLRKVHQLAKETDV